MGFTIVTPLTFPYSSLDWGFHYQLRWISGLWTQTEIYLLILQLEDRDILCSQLTFIICKLIPIIIFCSSCCSWESWFIYYFINTIDDHLSPSQSVILIIYLILGFSFVCSSFCLCRICTLFWVFENSLTALFCTHLSVLVCIHNVHWEKNTGIWS